MGESYREPLPCEAEAVGEIEHIDFVVVRLPFVHPHRGLPPRRS